MIRKCSKGGWEERPDSPLHAHHLIPKAGWEGTDKDGRVLLCKTHHDMIANILLARVGKVLKEYDPKAWAMMRNEIKTYTLWWLENGFN